MKFTVKILTIAAMVLLATAVFVSAEPQNNAGPSGERLGSGGFAEKILNDIRANNPDEAARLEQLRQDDPNQFRREIRTIAMKNMAMGGPGMEPGRKERGAEMGDRPEGRPDRQARDGGRSFAKERLQAMEGELITWLTKNEPAEANSLAALKGKDQQAYMRKIALDLKKYRQIMETEETNPALAEVLKKELKLKEQRNGLLEKFKAAANDKQKETIKAELKDVVSQTFDVKLQKKQFKYEDLKKKLEELQKSVNKSQTDLEKFKNDKDAQVDKYLESIISQSGQFDWD